MPTKKRETVEGLSWCNSHVLTGSELVETVHTPAVLLLAPLLLLATGGAVLGFMSRQRRPEGYAVMEP